MRGAIAIGIFFCAAIAALVLPEFLGDNNTPTPVNPSTLNPQLAFINLSDTPATYNGHGEDCLKVDMSETMVIFTDTCGGVVDFLALHDTINSFTGCDNKPLVVQTNRVICGEFPAVTVQGNLPTGGSTDEVLIKTNNTNYATNWGLVTFRNIADETITTTQIDDGSITADDINYNSTWAIGTRNSLATLTGTERLDISHLKGYDTQILAGDTSRWPYSKLPTDIARMKGHDGQLTGGVGMAGELSASDSDVDFMPPDYELVVPTNWYNRLNESSMYITVNCTIVGSPDGDVTIVFTQRDTSNNILTGVLPDTVLYNLTTGGKQELQVSSFNPLVRRLQFDAARGGTYASGESATCVVEGAYLVESEIKDGSIVPADLSSTSTWAEWIAAENGSIGQGLELSADGELSAIVALPVDSLPANPTPGDRIILLMQDSIADNRTETVVQDQSTLRRLPLPYVGGGIDPSIAIETFSNTYVGRTAEDTQAFRNQGIFRGTFQGKVPTRLHIAKEGGTLVSYQISSTTIPGNSGYRHITGFTYESLEADVKYTFNLEFADGTFAYRPTIYPPNDYVYNAADGWVHAPGVAAIWATPDDSSYVPRYKIDTNSRCYNGAGVGISVGNAAVNSGQHFAPAATGTGTCAGDWKADTTYRVSLVVTLGGSVLTSEGFDQYAAKAQRVIEVSREFDGSDVLATASYNPGGNPEGLFLFRLPLFDSTTPEGFFQFYATRQNGLKYISAEYFSHPTNTATSGFNISSQMRLREISITDKTS